jgi:hypothetical protein
VNTQERIEKETPRGVRIYTEKEVEAAEAET